MLFRIIELISQEWVCWLNVVETYLCMNNIFEGVEQSGPGIKSVCNLKEKTDVILDNYT